MTRVLRVNPSNPEPEVIEQAAEVIRKGGLVAFPTETVYGLGANALDEEAVLKIFKAKQRPVDNPIIVHIARYEELELLAEEIPPEVSLLAERFWPGPLTILVRRSELVPDATTAGLSTVAIRMPSHPVARALILRSELPIAAPSANLAGRPSPTTAEHVLADLGGRIDMILDGGEVLHGIESTVLDLTTKPAVILRPGPVTLEDLRKVIDVELHPSADSRVPVEVTIARSPGMKYKHYAPSVPLIVVEGETERIRNKIQELIKSLSGKRVGVLATEENAPFYDANVKVVGTRKDPRTVAKNLFKKMREMEKEVDVILAEGIEPVGIGLSVMNRLRKAAGYSIIQA